MNRIFVYIENGELKHISSNDPDELIITVVSRSNDTLGIEELHDTREASLNFMATWVKDVKEEIATRKVLNRGTYLTRLQEQVGDE